MRNSKRSDSVAKCQTIINEILEVKTFRFVEVQDFIGPGYTARQVNNNISYVLLF